jgi:L-serine dehydratase
VFDLFKVGIGPSSSHTVGPMRAAYLFVTRLAEGGNLHRVAAVRCQLFGSLGATGHGHGSVKAVVLGLTGEQPHLVDPVAADPLVSAVRTGGRIALAGQHEIVFSVDDDIVLHRNKRLDFHSNGMLFDAFDAEGGCVERREYYSVGAGFVLDRGDVRPVLVADDTVVRHPFSTGEEPWRIPGRPGWRSATSCWATNSPGAASATFAPGCCTSGRSCRRPCAAAPTPRASCRVA